MSGKGAHLAENVRKKELHDRRETALRVVEGRGHCPAGSGRPDLESLLAEFRPALRKLAGLLFRETPRLGASDIVQETLLDACRCPEAVRNGTPAQKFAWLRRALIRNIQDARRDQRRAKRRQSRDQSLETANLDLLVADDRSSPLARAESAEDWSRVAAALTGLRTVHRRVVRLFFWEDCSLEDIAERTGLSKSTARTMLRGALNRITRMISPRQPQDGTGSTGLPPQPTAG